MAMKSSWKRNLKKSLAYIALVFALSMSGILAAAVPKTHFVMRYPNTASTGVIDWPDLRRFGRVYVVSDVHGMFPAIARLLQMGRIIDSGMNWTAGNSLLVVLGDSIDKGPQSVEVLQLWMMLGPRAAQRGGMVLHLLGNHEAEFLSDPGDDTKARAFKRELKDKGIPLSAVTDPSQPMGAFLRDMPLAARLGRWLFAHAGSMPDMSWSAFSAKANGLLSNGQYDDPFLIADDSVLEDKYWWATISPTRGAVERILSADGFMGVVFGHQPTGLNVEGSCAISADRHLVKIDSGMAPGAGAHPGSLLVFPRPADLMGTNPPEVAMIRADGSVAQLPQEVPGPPLADLED